VAVAEYELKEQVRQERRRPSRQVGPVREVDGRFATGHSDLLEEHLGLDAVSDMTAK